MDNWRYANIALDIFCMILSLSLIHIYTYIFSGGEPTVRKDELIKLCEAHQDCVFLAFTNGTLVDEAFAKELHRVGNFALAFSIEGYEEETDMRRGKGTYAHVIRAMDILRKEGCVFGFSTCYHSKNAVSYTHLDVYKRQFLW